MNADPWSAGQLRTALVDYSAEVTAAAANHALKNNAVAARALAQVVGDLNEILRHWDIVTVPTIADALTARTSA